MTGINNGGKVRFRNDQRQLKKESDGLSLFVAAPGSTPITVIGDINSPNDPRSKIRLGFNSSNLIHRQILMTVDPNASLGFDRSYDGVKYDEQIDDMSWSLPNTNLIIQGIPAINDQVELPLKVTIRDDSSFEILIDDLMNIPTTQHIYLKDALLNVYVDLMNGNHTSPQLTAGTYEDRFYITFSQPSTLSTGAVELTDSDIILFTPNDIEELHIKKSVEIEIEELIIINMLGQQVNTYDVSNQNGTIRVNTSTLSSGNYIVKMNTNYGIQTRKVIIK